MRRFVERLARAVTTCWGAAAKLMDLSCDAVVLAVAAGTLVFALGLKFVLAVGPKVFPRGFDFDGSVGSCAAPLAPLVPDDVVVVGSSPVDLSESVNALRPATGPLSFEASAPPSVPGDGVSTELVAAASAG